MADFRNSVGWLLGITLTAATGLYAGAAAEPAGSGSSDGIVRVTAIVTDRRGQLVRNLKPSDFEVLEDGKVKTLEGAEYVTPAGTAKRTFAFLLDEFHTAPEDSALVRATLLRFIDTRLRPGDDVFVVKPLDSLSSIRPAENRAAVRQAIESFEGRKGDYTPRTAFERNYMAQAPEAVRAARAQIVTSVLRAIGNTLTRDDLGRPAIVFVSDGFERSRGSREVPANLQSAVRVINRADAPVYAFTPSLPPPPPPEGPDSGGDPGVLALRRLVKDTGGDLFTGAATFDAGFARMATDLDSHYVLTFRPGNGNDGRFHALQVGVKRADTDVRARSGYVAPLSDAMRAALTPPPTPPLRVLRRSPLIQSWSGMTPSDGGATVVLTWSPSMLVSGTRSRAASVVITASAADGSMLFDAAVSPAGESRDPNVPDHASFEAPAGLVRVEMKILDAKGIVLDTDSRDVTVPPLRPGGPTIYAPGVLRARSGREFRAIAEDPNAAPVPDRDFRRTDRLLVRVAVVDSDGTPAPVTATLLNRWRQPMRALEAMPERRGPVAQFDLPLSSLAPGEYTIRLSAAGPTGSVAEHVTFRVGS